MKQVEKTATILDKLAKAEVVADNVAVFEAIALNTLPIRKNHPLFKGAVHDRSFLEEMAAALNQESLPLQIMHETGDLPSGRVFYGEVRDTAQGSELRVLFFIDKTNEDMVKLVENGTVDQVSVSILAKQQLCSECGFDFFGEKATYENLWSATCENDHTMGTNGAHLVSKGLASWFEMSLVGKGGATGAKIIGRDRSIFADNRLAANGIDPLMLSETIKSSDLENLTMDLTKLVDELTSHKAENLTNAALIATQKTELDGLRTQLTDLTTELTALKAAPGVKQEDYDTAVNALKDIAKKIHVAAGDVDPKLDDKSVTDLVLSITEKSEALVTALAAAGKSKEQTTDADDPHSPISLTAFRVR